MSDLQSVEIKIYGQVFTLKGHSDPAHMTDLAAKVDAKMKEVAKPNEPPHRVAILVSLILMDELTKVRRTLDAERQRYDQAARSAAQLDLKLQHLLQEAAEPLEVEPTLVMEAQPEVLDVGGRVRDLFDEGDGR
jgi:cell division protein ZapA (FtsZ GTPase activity inhibitor)